VEEAAEEEEGAVEDGVEEDGDFSVTIYFVMARARPF